MLALLMMTNPMWEFLIGPLALLGIGYWLRGLMDGPVARWLDRMDEIDRLNRPVQSPMSHVRRVGNRNGLDGPYDWAEEDSPDQN